MTGNAVGTTLPHSAAHTNQGTSNIPTSTHKTRHPIHHLSVLLLHGQPLMQEHLQRGAQKSSPKGVWRWAVKGLSWPQEHLWCKVTLTFGLESPHWSPGRLWCKPRNLRGLRWLPVHSNQLLHLDFDIKASKVIFQIIFLHWGTWMVKKCIYISSLYWSLVVHQLHTF